MGIARGAESGHGARRGLDLGLAGGRSTWTARKDLSFMWWVLLLSGRANLYGNFRLSRLPML